MAKNVDHEQRKRELADAALTVVETTGLDGLTIRAVAAEAGWSTGALAHYFNNKDALLQAAHHRVIERILARAGRAESSSSPLMRLRETLLSTLPIDDERYAELTIWFAFLARALARTDFGDQQRAGHRFWISEIERHISAAQVAGELPEGKDAHHEAQELSLFVDGVYLQGALFHADGMPPSELIAMVDSELARLAGP